MSYCKLYIDVEMGIEGLQNLIDIRTSNFVEFGSLGAIVFDNESYQVDSRSQSKTYPVDRSRYYVEIEPVSGRTLEKSIFEYAVAMLVNQLRTQCQYVVASCAFEDYIVEQTGWNWTVENPFPPQ